MYIFYIMYLTKKTCQFVLLISLHISQLFDIRISISLYTDQKENFKIYVPNTNNY